MTCAAPVRTCRFASVVVMANSIRFYFIDVFAARPLTGNPLALIPDADVLSVSQMQAIAREFNQSETTFILTPTVADATVRLRSFTPNGSEVGGAGHNALGAWLWLAQSGRVGQDPARVLRQQIASRVLPVEIIRQPGRPVQVGMEQSAPEFGAVVADTELLAAALGLGHADICVTAPAQVVSTGAAHLLVPVGDRAAVDRARPDSAALAAVLRGTEGEGCYLYTTAPVGDGAHAYARFFNPTMGISEDPATGTAAGPLAAALVRAGLVCADGDVVIEQGHALGRPSRLRLQVDGDRIRLLGSGLVVADGTLLLGEETPPLERSPVVSEGA